jgi:uncharacterized protein
MRYIGTTIVVGLMSFTLANCGSLSARPDPSRFFTLSALRETDTAAKTQRAQEGISLGVGPIKFPGYLDRQEIVVRSAQNRFDVSEYDHWAEPLVDNFERVLEQNLSDLLGTDRIVSYPWAVSGRPSYQLQLEVIRFEANGTREAQLAARWSVFAADKRVSIQNRESRISRPLQAQSTDAAVAALSATLGDLSREIADAVKSIHEQKK